MIKVHKYFRKSLHIKDCAGSACAISEKADKFFEQLKNDFFMIAFGWIFIFMASRYAE